MESKTLTNERIKGKKNKMELYSVFIFSANNLYTQKENTRNVFFFLNWNGKGKREKKKEKEKKTSLCESLYPKQQNYKSLVCTRTPHMFISLMQMIA